MNPEQARLPYRPRLADFATIRRHVVDGQERILVRDGRNEQVIQIDAQQLELLRCADGTRELGGIVLAAVRRGIFRRSSDVHGFFWQLNEHGLLADGIVAPEPNAAAHPERPLEVLADFRLTCQSTGVCCETYSSVSFSQREAARAHSLVPDALGENADLRRVFMPTQSSADTYHCAVTMVDGHCPYLNEQGQCRVQLAAGAAAKPQGCRIFPTTYVDDGTAVRVSVAVECPCVLASIDLDGGEPLVPPAARQESDLPRGCYVVRLPEQIVLTPERLAERELLRAWSVAIAERANEQDDVVAAFWALADAVRQHGLDPSAATAALQGAQAPSSAALTFAVMSLSGRAQNKEQAATCWRSEKDRTRQLAVWLAAGADDLIDPSTVEQRLAESAAFRQHEHFYLRATIMGHHLIGPGLSLEQALRDRATRLLLARQMAHNVPELCAQHPAVPYPLTAVEAMMRGQGLDSYAH